MNTNTNHIGIETGIGRVTLQSLLSAANDALRTEEGLTIGALENLFTRMNILVCRKDNEAGLSPEELGAYKTFVDEWRGVAGAINATHFYDVAAA